jgi:hypothetical protein
MITNNGPQSSSAQNPDIHPFLEENGQYPDQFTRASEPSLPGFGVPFEVLPPRMLSRSDISRTTEAVVSFQASVVSNRQRHPQTANGLHAPRDAPEPDSP